MKNFTPFYHSNLDLLREGIRLQYMQKIRTPDIWFLLEIYAIQLISNLHTQCLGCLLANTLSFFHIKVITVA